MEERFGRLIKVSDAGFREYPSGRRRMWEMRCDCGRVVVTDATRVKAGKVKSCGCLHSDLLREAKTTHGLSQRPEYFIWSSMRERCTNPNSTSYATYGGRGITICKEWAESFLSFYEHIGPRPSPRHSVDRIDNNRGYEPGNVRWATPVEQGSNTRRTRAVVLDGERVSLTEYSRRTGLSLSTIRRRMSHYGWSFDEALDVRDGRKGSANK